MLRLHKPWHYILGFAVLGLAVAAVGYIYALYIFHWSEPTRLDTTVSILSVVLCPPSLLFAGCIDCEVGTGAGVFMYSASGVLNAVIYGATIGAWLGYRRKTKTN
jgi:hypothetical protein